VDQAVYDALINNVPKYKLITVAIVSERLKVNGSVARVGIRHLEEEGLIKKVDKSGSTWIYTPAK
jgi:small subunit ribosomal protein S25e